MGYPFTWTQSRYIWRRPFDMPTKLPMGDFYDNCGVCSNDPAAQGIFGGAGRAAHFTRGIFDEHPPYALPDYVLREPDGVDGIGNYEGFGDSAAADKLIAAIATNLAAAADSLVPGSVQTVLSFAGYDLKSSVYDAAVTALNKQKTKLSAASNKAAVKTALGSFVIAVATSSKTTTNVTIPTAALNSAVDAAWLTVFGAAPTTPAVDAPSGGSSWGYKPVAPPFKSAVVDVTMLPNVVSLPAPKEPTTAKESTTARNLALVAGAGVLALLAFKFLR